MFTSLRRRLPRLGRFPRLCGIGICLLLALDSAASRSSRSRAAAVPTAVPVVAAARTLPVGHVLQRADLTVLRWPRPLRPATARADPAALVGRRLAGPLARGEPVTATRLLGRDLATGLPSGLVAVAVPLVDGSALDLVRPGDRVDLLAAPRTDEVDGRPAPGSIATLARAAPALAVLGTEPDGDAGSAAGGLAGAGAEIVLAVPRAAAVAISRAAPSHLFTAVLVSP